MQKPFQDLKIVGVDKDRCYVVEGSVVRVYLQLSEPPPFGWSYMFSGVWQAAPHALKRQLGVEDDSIWIECNPEEVRHHHLEELERAVSQTNANFRATIQQKEVAKRAQMALDERARSQLEILTRSFDPQTKHSLGSGTNRRSWIRRLLDSIRRSL